MYYCFSELIFDYLHGITILRWRCKSSIIKGYRTCGRGKITNNGEARMGGTGSGYGAVMDKAQRINLLHSILRISKLCYFSRFMVGSEGRRF